MNPADNLVLAKVMTAPLKKVPEEAGYRCACGRAYYAAFAYARDALMSAKFAFAHNGKDHARVPSLLNKAKISDVQLAASLLQQLHDHRKSADYDVGLKLPPAGEVFDDARAQTAVLLANTVIDEIDKARAADKRLSIPVEVT